MGGFGCKAVGLKMPEREEVPQEGVASRQSRIVGKGEAASLPESGEKGHSVGESVAGNVSCGFPDSAALLFQGMEGSGIGFHSSGLTGLQVPEREPVPQEGGMFRQDRIVGECEAVFSPEGGESGQPVREATAGKAFLIRTGNVGETFFSGPEGRRGVGFHSSGWTGLQAPEREPVVVFRQGRIVGECEAVSSPEGGERGQPVREATAGKRGDVGKSFFFGLGKENASPAVWDPCLFHRLPGNRVGRNVPERKRRAVSYEGVASRVPAVGIGNAGEEGGQPPGQGSAVSFPMEEGRPGSRRVGTGERERNAGAVGMSAERRAEKGVETGKPPWGFRVLEKEREVSLAEYGVVGSHPSERRRGERSFWKGNPRRRFRRRMDGLFPEIGRERERRRKRDGEAGNRSIRRKGLGKEGNF